MQIRTVQSTKRTEFRTSGFFGAGAARGRLHFGVQSDRQMLTDVLVSLR
jgi:hypothetical protein